jgi:hypothetical protein
MRLAYAAFSGTCSTKRHSAQWSPLARVGSRVLQMGIAAGHRG